jgi:hypothetical protein
MKPNEPRLRRWVGWAVAGLGALVICMTPWWVDIEVGGILTVLYWVWH